MTHRKVYRKSQYQNQLANIEAAKGNLRRRRDYISRGLSRAPKYATVSKIQPVVKGMKKGLPMIREESEPMRLQYFPLEFKGFPTRMRQIESSPIHSPEYSPFKLPSYSPISEGSDLGLFSPLSSPEEESNFMEAPKRAATYGTSPSRAYPYKHYETDEDTDWED